MKFFPKAASKPARPVSAGEGEASLYLKDMVSQVGRALVASHRKMEEQWLRSLRERNRMIEMGANPAFIPSPSVFVIPELDLSLQVQISGRQSTEESVGLNVKPMDPRSLQKGEIDSTLNSELKLKFKLLPEPAAGSETLEASALTPDKAMETVTGHALFKEFMKRKAYARVELRSSYSRDSRKWTVSVFDGPDRAASAIVDDSTGTLIDLLDLLVPVSPESLDELGPPVIKSSPRSAAALGERILLEGDNLCGLDPSRTNIRLGKVRIVPDLLAITRLEFTVTPVMVGGLLTIETEFGSADSDWIDVLAKGTVISPDAGYFDRQSKTGSVFCVQGGGFRGKCQLEFSNGARTRPFKVSDDGAQAWFRTPETATEGALSVVTTLRDGSEKAAMISGVVFRIRPFISGVSPKEGRQGDTVEIRGNHLDRVTEIQIGSNRYKLAVAEGPNSVAAISAPGSLSFKVSKSMSDGVLSVIAESIAYDSRVFFYRLPTMLEVPRFATRGEILEVTASGLGGQRDSIFARFPGESGKRQVRPQFLDILDDGACRLGFVVPSDAVSGKIRFSRSEVFDAKNPEGSSASATRDTILLQPGTVVLSHLYVEPPA